MNINDINSSDTSNFKTTTIKPPAQKTQLEALLNNLSSEDKQKIMAKAEGMLDSKDQSANGEVLDKLSNSDVQKLLSEARDLAQKEKNTTDNSNNADSSKISLTEEDKNTLKVNIQEDLEKFSQNNEGNKTKLEELTHLMDYIDYMDNNNYDIKYDADTNSLESVNKKI